jgi:hypothetical protein
MDRDRFLTEGVHADLPKLRGEGRRQIRGRRMRLPSRQRSLS